MISVIQIFKFIRIIEKPDYTTEGRKALGNWPESIESASGFIDGGVLYMPGELKSENVNHAELIILNDDVRPDQGFASAEAWRIDQHHQMNTPRPTEIFRIGKKEKEGYDLFLNYDQNSTIIGHPRRENHKVAELMLGKPVRYRINGKSDFTLSGRKQRTFHELDYIIEYVGPVEKIEFIEEHEISSKKNIDSGACKLIDERKLF